MKDITIFENFINDEELEEAQQFTGDESIHFYDYKNTVERGSDWFLSPVDKCYKKHIIDLRPERLWRDGMENTIPSVKKFILKIKNRLNKYTNTTFDLQRVYLNRQVYGQDVPLHKDTDKFNGYTFLIYLGDITPENYTKTGGDLEFENKEHTKIEPFTKRAVLFRGYIPHQAYAPLIPDITRISMAFKIIDTVNELPFSVQYS